MRCVILICALLLTACGGSEPQETRQNAKRVDGRLPSSTTPEPFELEPELLIMDTQGDMISIVAVFWNDVEKRLSWSMSDTDTWTLASWSIDLEEQKVLKNNLELSCFFDQDFNPSLSSLTITCSHPWIDQIFVTF